MKTGLMAWVAGAIALAGWAGTTAAQQTKLLASIFFPAAHPIYSKVIVPWAQDVEKASGGELKVEFSAASLAPPPGQLDLVGNGIADIAIQFSGVVPNRLKLTLIGEQFGPVSTARAMSTALWRTHVKFFEPANEYKGLKLIALVAFPPQQFYTVREPIVSFEQLKRAKVAVTPGTLAKAYGAITTGVVAVPAVRFFDLVSKGMVDAFVVTPIEIYSFNLRDYTRYAMRFRETGTVTATFAIVMNEAKWKSLNPAQQAAIERHSGEAFAVRMSAVDEVAESANEKARREGIRFIDAPPEFNEEVRKAFRFTVDEWIAAAQSRGVDGRAALEFYHAEHLKLSRSAR